VVRKISVKNPQCINVFLLGLRVLEIKVRDKAQLCGFLPFTLNILREKLWKVVSYRAQKDGVDFKG